jgi:hypothetical protein
MNFYPKIEAALNRLLASEEGAFVIFDDRASGKFVQFAGSRDEPLVLDLPVQQLSAAELERAKILFRDLGIGYEEWPVFDKPGGQEIGAQGGFQLELGQDTRRGADLTLRVFTEVFQRSDLSLVIEES